MNLRKQGQAARARHDRNATHKQVATDMRMLRKFMRNVSYVVLAPRCGLIDSTLAEAKSSVYPSGAARATLPAGMSWEANFNIMRTFSVAA